jgi:serine/threonine protein kinase
MLTGAYPWEIDISGFYDFDDFRKKIIEARKKRPTAPSLVDSKIPKELDDIVIKSLELDIENRYTNGMDFLEAINKIIIT